MERIFRVSVERCIACGKCELACAFSHGQDGLPPPPGSGSSARGRSGGSR